MTEKVERRLAAVLSADVVGYSRLMGVDEEGTYTRLKTHLEELLKPKIDERRGSVIKFTGDGLLAGFSSAVDAVRCAVAVQREMVERNAEEDEQRRMEFRIGVNLGDIIIEADDIFGDGVNIADPGGVCISGKVYEEVRNRLDLAFESRGQQSVKNIAEPIAVFSVPIAESRAPRKADQESRATPNQGGQSAIAVLPFDNMSGDPDQEYFADGLTEDIITELSYQRLFPVVARNSTFAYKGTSLDIKRVGEELGASYVVEGSVRKGGNRVRITAQLIDTATGHHVWAERYDRKLDDLFAVQDEITQRIAGAIEPELDMFERARAVAQRPADIDAWDCYHRGMAYLYEGTKEGHANARKQFARRRRSTPATAVAIAGWPGATIATSCRASATHPPNRYPNSWKTPGRQSSATIATPTRTF